MKNQISKLTNELKAFASKTSNPHEAEDFLDDLRKKISKCVRSKVTGGDILTIDDFAIDLNHLTSVERLHHRERIKEIKRLKNGLKNMEGLSNLVAIAEQEVNQENENNLNK